MHLPYLLMQELVTGSVLPALFHTSTNNSYQIIPQLLPFGSFRKISKSRIVGLASRLAFSRLDETRSYKILNAICNRVRPGAVHWGLCAVCCTSGSNVTSVRIAPSPSSPLRPGSMVRSSANWKRASATWWKNAQTISSASGFSSASRSNPYRLQEVQAGCYSKGFWPI